MRSKQYTVCRACHAQCGLIVEFDEHGDPCNTYGDKDNPAYFGYSCIKGRELANNHALDTRLLHSQKRINSAHNSNWRDNQSLNGKYTFNPAFMNPDDTQALKIEDGDQIEIGSARASIIGIAIAAQDIRLGCVSMAHGWGGNPPDTEDPNKLGSNTGKLCFTDQDYDLRTGIPRMSNIPVTISPAKSCS